MEKTHEERLVALESKLAHQDYLLDVLNETVYRQQKQLDELDTLCAVLAKRVTELRTNQPDSTLPHEKPPHY